MASAATALADADLDRLTDEDLLADLVDAVRGAFSVHAQVLRRIADVDRRGALSGTGATSIVAFLREATGISAGRARAWQTTASALYAQDSSAAPLAATANLLELGEIADSHADTMVRTVAAAADALSERARDELAQGSCGVRPAQDDEAVRERSCRLRREFEGALLNEAQRRDVGAFGRFARRALIVLDADRGERDADAAREARWATAAATLGGVVSLRAELDAEGGAYLLAALDAASAPVRGPDGERDPRTAVRRRADGLISIAKHYLDSGAAPSSGGLVPHVIITTPWDTFATLRARSSGCGAASDDPFPHESSAVGRPSPDDDDADEVPLGASVDAGDRGEGSAFIPPGVTTLGQVLEPETVRRIACDALVTRVVTHDAPPGAPPLTRADGPSPGNSDIDVGRDGPRNGSGSWPSNLVRYLTGPSVPLDVGRAFRTVPSWLRAALVVRDQGCAFPSCDRPPHWCQAHHIWHWADGGPTALDNLVLLCQHHHTVVHHEGWTVQVDAATGRPVFTPPPDVLQRWRRGRAA